MLLKCLRVCFYFRSQASEGQPGFYPPDAVSLTSINSIVFYYSVGLLGPVKWGWMGPLPSPVYVPHQARSGIAWTGKH